MAFFSIPPFLSPPALDTNAKVKKKVAFSCVYRVLPRRLAPHYGRYASGMFPPLLLWLSVSRSAPMDVCLSAPTPHILFLLGYIFAPSFPPYHCISKQ